MLGGKKRIASIFNVMESWTNLRTGTKVTIILVMLFALLLNAWNHGGTIFSPGSLFCLGMPFNFYSEQPTWTGEDWDFDHIKVYFLFVGLLMNILFWAVVIWISMKTGEWFFTRMDM